MLFKIQSVPVIDCSSKFALVRNYQEMLIIYHSKLDDSYKKPLRAKKKLLTFKTVKSFFSATLTFSVMRVILYVYKMEIFETV